MAQMKEQIKTPEKELNELEISNIANAEFKTLVIRMLKEFGEDVSSIKRIQSETKDALIEIKRSLQGNNSRVDEAEIQINGLENKGGKKHAEQQEEKRIQKNEDSRRSLWENFQEVQHLHHKGTRRRRERVRNWKSI